MLGGADNPNGELPSYITGADIGTCKLNGVEPSATSTMCLMLSPTGL